MSQRAYVISDMYGDLAEPLERRYIDATKALLSESGFDVRIVWLNHAAGITTSAHLAKQLIQAELHSQYISGGLTAATEQIATVFKETSEPCTIIAFSMGGFAAWEAADSLAQVSRMLLLSSTRLRLATAGRNGVSCQAVFGNNDTNAPSFSQCDRLKIGALYIEGGHEFYKDLTLIESLIRQWLVPSH